ncbi:hypothetical protein ACIRPO_12190 [Streptomyces bacillaris]|uniref:hypothetical protein n=1 Tax=Streptomyces bacillaris TaxID=68179 RepID=UPI00380D50C7
MLTYQDVVTIRLAPLTAAAESWSEMADGFEELGRAYGGSVQSVTTDGEWVGESAEAAHSSLKATRKQFDAAAVEARAISDILRDIHGQFSERIQEVKRLVDSAKEADIHIDADGRAHLDVSERSEAAGGLFGDSMVRAAHEARWTVAVAAAVRSVDDADQGARLALRAAAGVKSFAEGIFDSIAGVQGDFNAEAIGDIEAVEALAVKRYADQVIAGEKPTDMAEFERLMRDNSGDEVFSRTLLNSLGPEGTIKLANGLSDLAYFDDKRNKANYLNLQGSLAASLSSATRDTGSEFYKRFRKGMQQAGVKKYDLDVAGEKIPVGTGHGQQARGYQSLVTLMQQGEGYSDRFMHDMADDIRKAEDKNQGGDPNMWDLRGDFSAEDDGWFANDPLDGLLGVMSKDAEAVTAYLDPGEKGENDTLKYLLTGRQWDHVDTSDWRGNIEHSAKDTFDSDVRAGLGLALEVGSTGNQPGGEGARFGRHSPEQARIMHETVNYLDYGAADGKSGEQKGSPRVGKADELLAKDEYAALRAPLSRALADYSPDMVDIVTGDAPGGRAGAAGAHMSGEGSQIQNSRSSLLRMMRGVSESDDPSNFELIYHAQRGYISQEMMVQDFPDSLSVINESRKVGEVFGALDAVGGDVKMDVHDDKISDATDKRFYGYHLGGGAITGIPVVGDAAQRLVDVSLNDWLSGVQAEEGALAKEELSRGNDLAQDNLDRYFETWGEERKVNKSLSVSAGAEARQSYVAGREIAYEALRSRN